MNRQRVRSPDSSQALRWLSASTVIGILALAAGGILQPQRLWPNLLLFGYIAVGFGLGGLLLMAFRDLTGAHWNDRFRCVREAMAATLPWTAPLLGIIVLTGIPSYPWARPDVLAGETFWFKRWWLEPNFFAVRTIVYLAIWMALARIMLRSARREATPGGPASRSIRLSAAFLVLYSLTFWMASTDWIMSLEPTWYSTIFSVYHFGGILLSAQAAAILLIIWLQQSGTFRHSVTTDQLRDLGTLLLSFSCLWMYFWFSQYMLIWYTNMPEETSHFERRHLGLWMPLFVANIVINWGIPFAVLLPRAPKRNAGALVKISLLLLVGRWLDVYLTILPSTGATGPSIGPCEIGAIALTIGLPGLLFLQALQESPSYLTPLRSAAPDAGGHRNQEQTEPAKSLSEN